MMSNVSSYCHSTIADHLLRNPICEELPLWKKIAYTVSFVVVGLLSLFIPHLIYNLALREKPKDDGPQKKIFSEKSSLGLPAPSHKATPTSKSSHINSPTFVITQTEKKKEKLQNKTTSLTIKNEVPPLEKLALEGVLKHNKAPSTHLNLVLKTAKKYCIKKEQMLPYLTQHTGGIVLREWCLSYSPVDFKFSGSFQNCRTLDFSGCQITKINDLVVNLGKHLPLLEGLFLWDCPLVSVQSFQTMTTTCSHLRALHIAFGEYSFKKETDNPFYHCKNLVEVRYSISTLHKAHFEYLLNANRLYSVTVWTSNFSGYTATNFKEEISKITITPRLGKSDPRYPSLSFMLSSSLKMKFKENKTHEAFKHKTLPMGIYCTEVDPSRAYMKESCMKEIQERRPYPANQTKNFNAVAFKEWISSLKSDPKKLKDYLSAMCFHFLLDSSKFRNKQEYLNQLAAIFAEEFSMKELELLAPLLTPLPLIQKDADIFNDIFFRFLSCVRAQMLILSTIFEPVYDEKGINNGFKKHTDQAMVKKADFFKEKVLTSFNPFSKKKS